VVGATRDGLALAKEGLGKHPERYKPVKQGNIFYNPMRIMIGSIAYAESETDIGITSPDYVVFRAETNFLNHCWFYHWLRSPFGDSLIRTLARGAVRERMLFSRLSKGSIELPSLDAQNSAAEKILKLTPLIDQIRHMIAEINALPQALLRQAFNGEL